jgi:hypothetical protein
MVVEIIKTTAINFLQRTHIIVLNNRSVVEIATSFNILYNSPEDGHQIGRNMSRWRVKLKTSWIFDAQDSFTNKPW